MLTRLERAAARRRLQRRGPSRRTRRGRTGQAYDHTSILRIIERKWNLPLTRRDAAAADPLDDVLDLAAPPAFLAPRNCPGRPGPPRTH